MCMKKKSGNSSGAVSPDCEKKPQTNESERRAGFPGYYFNNGKCESYVFGEGQAIFISEEECAKKCIAEPEEDTGKVAEEETEEPAENAERENDVIDSCQDENDLCSEVKNRENRLELCKYTAVGEQCKKTCGKC